MRGNIVDTLKCKFPNTVMFRLVVFNGGGRMVLKDGELDLGNE